MNFEEKSNQYKRAIEAALDATLKSADARPSRVLDAMRYSLLGGGKRVRGMLTLAACELVSGDFKCALPAACAIEILHCYSLIHDDLPVMDDDDLRRGQPSCHIRFDQATALLAGDALLTLAFGVLTNLKNAQAAITCVMMLAQAAGHEGMILGQEMDLAARGKAPDAGQLATLHALKTGALLRASAGMGAVIGDANQEQADALCRYADAVGLAFQAIDDILDVTSDTAVLGKPAGSDAVAHNQTGAVVYGIAGARDLAKTYTDTAVSALDCFENTEYLVEFANNLLKRDR